MWLDRADVGSESKACLILPDWCFSTKPLSLPLWYDLEDEPRAE
jgi:hypothetical protein